MSLPSSRARMILSSALAILIAALGATSAVADPADAGRAHFMRSADTTFDTFMASPTTTQKDWMRAHYWRMRGYSPSFDSRLAWAPKTWVYQSAYAIYVGGPVARDHPDWILRDAAGNKLYIPFGCKNGTCPQYAGDIGNPAFRSWWISQARARLALGLRRHLHRRRQPLPQGRQRRRAAGRPDRPAHRHGDDRDGVAALSRRPHGGRARRVPEHGDRPQRHLVRRRDDHGPASPTALGQLHQPRAGRQRRGAHRGHRQMEPPASARVRRPSARRGPRRRLRRAGHHRRRPALQPGGLPARLVRR